MKKSPAHILFLALQTNRYKTHAALFASLALFPGIRD
uniref:Uncharacterized protein n=1 Tax=Parascaris equorum TaxID=6256 RepID=A0A914REJ5_PAREQ